MQQARKVSGHVSGIDFASTIFQLDFITVPTAGYFRGFFLFYKTDEFIISTVTINNSNSKQPNP
jgi:hypothetical protein